MTYDLPSTRLQGGLRLALLRAAPFHVCNNRCTPLAIARNRVTDAPASRQA